MICAESVCDKCLLNQMGGLIFEVRQMLLSRIRIRNGETRRMSLFEQRSIENFDSVGFAARRGDSKKDRFPERQLLITANCDRIFLIHHRC